MRRALLWVLILPFAAVSVLVGHGVAYSVTRTPADDFHGYLDHAPQVLAVLLLVGLVGLAYESRARSLSVFPVAATAVVGFACQEHLERLLHTGSLPLLLTSPTFWVGLALQLPFAAVVWLVARRLARTIARAERSGPPRLAILPLTRPATRLYAPAAFSAGAVPGRGPPCPS
jgi:hypothetical protein